MSKFIKSVAAAAVLATSATGVQAAELSTDVDVSLPEIIALFCYDSVVVNVSADGLTAALGGTLTSTGLGEATVENFTGDLGASSSGSLEAPDTEVNLQLNNVCAFRALVETGVSVSVAEAADPVLVNEDVETAVINAAGIELSSDAEVDAADLGLAVAPTPIDVTVPLDLSGATAPGTYSKEELFTVTVAAL